MRNEEQSFVARVLPTAGEVTKGSGEARRGQALRGVAGRLRPYRDVRAGFDIWRRVALREWAAREDSMTVN